MKRKLMRLYWRARMSLGEALERARGEVATCKICGTHVLSYWGGSNWGPDSSGYCFNCYEEYVSPREYPCDGCGEYYPADYLSGIRMHDTHNHYSVCDKCVEALVPNRAELWD
jgi:hypothetical protein